MPSSSRESRRAGIYDRKTLVFAHYFKIVFIYFSEGYSIFRSFRIS